jgi:hypothetical protein
VKPYVKRQKNDAADAEAICEAMTRASMRFVEIKSPEQQNVMSLPAGSPHGSVGDSYDNALAETINGLYKAEVIHRRGPWRNSEAVEVAKLEWVDWFNNRRLLELHRQHPAGGSRGTLLRHAGRTSLGRVTQTKRPPANPERFSGAEPGDTWLGPTVLFAAEDTEDESDAERDDDGAQWIALNLIFEGRHAGVSRVACCLNRVVAEISSLPPKLIANTPSVPRGSPDGLAYCGLSLRSLSGELANCLRHRGNISAKCFDILLQVFFFWHRAIHKFAGTEKPRPLLLHSAGWLRNFREGVFGCLFTAARREIAERNYPTKTFRPCQHRETAHLVPRHVVSHSLHSAVGA